MEVVFDDLVRLVVGVGDVAGDLGDRDFFCHKAKGGRRPIGFFLAGKSVLVTD